MTDVLTNDKYRARPTVSYSEKRWAIERKRWWGWECITSVTSEERAQEFLDHTRGPVLYPRANGSALMVSRDE